MTVRDQINQRALETGEKPTFSIDMSRVMIRCSELERVKQCPGSVRFIASLPPMKRKETPWSEAGTRIHTGIMSSLIGPDLGAAVSLHGEDSRLAAEYVERVIVERDRYGAMEAKPHCEVELTNVALGLIGHPDVFLTHKQYGLIIDYKTGWSELPEADRNMQLRGYAVLLAETYDLKSVRVVLMERNSTTRCDYESVDLIEARSEIKRIVAAASKANAPLHAGEHCKYCPANGVCKEAAKYATSLQTIEGLPIERLYPDEVAECMSVEGVHEFIRKWPVIQKIAEAIKDRAKQMAANGEDVPWTLKPGVKRAEIKDAQQAFRLMYGTLSADQFAACCKVIIGDIDKQVAQIEGLSLKDAKEEVRFILKDVIEYKEASPQLELKGEK